jgi:hypothetical protein
VATLWRQRDDWIAIAAADKAAFHCSRIPGGDEWVRSGAVELALDCLGCFLHGLPVVERIDCKKS